VRLKTWAAGIFSHYLNEEIVELIFSVPKSLDGTAEDRADEPARMTWEANFLGVVRAVDIVLEHTCEKASIRLCMFEIEWSRFALGNYRTQWLDLFERYPGYAVDLVTYQAKDEWVMRQAGIVENRRKAAARKKAAISA